MEAELEARAVRAGDRGKVLSAEVARGLTWALEHRLFKLGDPLMVTKGRSMVESNIPFVRLGDGKKLNGGLLQSLYRGDQRLGTYAESFFFDQHRPSSRPQESSGLFFKVPALVSEVRGVENFFEMRRSSCNESELLNEAIGKMPVLGCSLASELLQGYRRNFGYLKKIIPESTPSTTKKATLIDLVVQARKAIKRNNGDLDEAYRNSAPDGTADPPPPVPVDNWPDLSDRGDGVEGSPVDHCLIAFSDAVMCELKDSGDYAHREPSGDGGSDDGSDGDGGDIFMAPASQQSMASTQPTPMGADQQEE